MATPVVFDGRHATDRRNDIVKRSLEPVPATDLWRSRLRQTRGQSIYGIGLKKAV